MAKPAGKQSTETAPRREGKSGRGWFGFWFWLVVIVVGGGGFHAAYKLERLPPEVMTVADAVYDTFAEVAEFAAPTVGGEQSTATAPEFDDSADAGVDGGGVVAAAAEEEMQMQEESGEVYANENTSAVATPSPSPPSAEVEKQLSMLNERMTAVEQRLAQMPAPVDSAQAAVVQLQFIDLALRTTGNTAAAAAALESLAEAANDEARARLLRAEATRLREAPERKSITAAIGKLRELLADVKDLPVQYESGKGAAVDFVFALLRVSKVSESKTRAAGLDETLQRMEWLITVGRSEAYLNELGDAAAKWQRAQTPADDSNIARLFERLQEMGAPQYRLGAIGA